MEIAIYATTVATVWVARNGQRGRIPLATLLRFLKAGTTQLREVVSAFSLRFYSAEHPTLDMTKALPHGK